MPKPFVEFMGDTWGDQYYFIARRPPFDAAAVKEAYADALYSNNGYLSIHPNKVLSTSLTWSVNTAYSWYRLAASVGFNNNDDIGGIPAVFFPEMAALFGSRVCNIQSNYVNLIADGSSAIHNQDKEVADTTKENVIRSHYRCLLDLKYLIESTIYVPFTRQGTITLYGDRRINVVRGCISFLQENYITLNRSPTRLKALAIPFSVQRHFRFHTVCLCAISKALGVMENTTRICLIATSILLIWRSGFLENIGVKNSEGYPNELFRFVADFKIRKEVLDYSWSKKQVLETRTNLYMTEEELNEG